MLKTLKSAPHSVAQNAAIHWYSFSHFIPKFLMKITDAIQESSIKERILKIVHEENGSGIPQRKHDYLFQIAMSEIGLDTFQKDIASINQFHKKYMDELMFEEDKEAFVIGISYGLEIIAEDNIARLLSLTAYSPANLEILRRTAFFEIHLVNEIDHIRACENNFNFIKIHGRSAAFIRGQNLSLKFWNQFWRDVENE